MGDGNTERTNDNEANEKIVADWLPLLGCRDQVRKWYSWIQRVSISGRRKLYLCNEMQSQGHVGHTAAFRDFRLEAGKDISWLLFFCLSPISSSCHELKPAACPLFGTFISYSVEQRRGVRNRSKGNLAQDEHTTPGGIIIQTVLSLQDGK